MQDCSARELTLDWSKGAVPAGLTSTRQTGCIICSDSLQDKCEIKHGRSYIARGRRGRFISLMSPMLLPSLPCCCPSSLHN